jgi:hypothetical protein
MSARTPRNFGDLHKDLQKAAFNPANTPHIANTEWSSSARHPPALEVNGKAVSGVTLGMNANGEVPYLSFDMQDSSGKTVPVTFARTDYGVEFSQGGFGDHIDPKTASATANQILNHPTIQAEAKSFAGDKGQNGLTNMGKEITKAYPPLLAHSTRPSGPGMMST